MYFEIYIILIAASVLLDHLLQKMGTPHCTMCDIGGSHEQMPDRDWSNIPVIQIHLAYHSDWSIFIYSIPSTPGRSTRSVALSQLLVVQDMM